MRTSIHILLTLLTPWFVVPTSACADREPNSATIPPEDPPYGEHEESTFCTLIQPVVKSLQEAVGPSFQCMQMNYNEIGHFGPGNDVMESSISSACFDGLDRFTPILRTPIKDLVSLNEKVQADLQIGPGGLVDLTEYGVVPSLYQLRAPQGLIKATVEIGYYQPKLAALRDLGYTLTRTAKNPSTNKSVRSSVESCIEKLCGEETYYTSSVVYARPVVTITLERGTAAGLDPIEDPKSVHVATTSPQTFMIRARRPMVLAAQVNPSRNMMIGQSSCPEGGGDGDGDGGETGELPIPLINCKTIRRLGVEATYIGCGRNGGPKSNKVECKLRLMSPDYDQPFRLDVRSNDREGSVLIDGKGTAHTAAWAELPNLRTEHYARAKLLADHPMDLTMFYENVPTGTKEISQLNIRLVTQSYVDFDFRDTRILDDVDMLDDVVCRAKGKR